MADNEEFQSVDKSVGSKTYPTQCSALRKNGFVLIKNRPCKIVEMSTSKPGKHGHAKVHMVALDIFTGKKYDEICPSSHNMNVPHVKRSDFQLVNIDEDGFATLMDDNGSIRSDIKIPDGDLGKDIRERFDKEENFLCTLLSAMDEEAIVGTKNMTK